MCMLCWWYASDLYFSEQRPWHRDASGSGKCLQALDGMSWSMSFALQQMTPVFLVTLAGALIACCPVKKLISEKKWYGPVAYVCSLTGLVICILSLASGTYNPFIYFRF